MPDIYRTALQVSPERIAALDDGDLNELMLDLMKAQAFLARADVTEIVVNTEGIAKDGGADGASPAPPQPDAWLGDVATTWQFKAGTAGQPSRLKNPSEVRKPIPRETLEAGGRFVVVASGSTSGQQGVDLRRNALVEDAEAAGIPSSRIEVFGSEALTLWCNQHPAVAARWAGRPAGLWRIAEWERSGEHDVEWQPVQGQSDAISKHRADLDVESGEVLHLHVFGHPGVGKSRFALELCRGAPWERFVVYIRQAADIRLLELVDSCADDSGVRLVIVADEVELEQILSLRASVARANRRIRLVTIGPSASPDPERVVGFEVQPLPENVVAEVVRRWHRGMPPEHADFVAGFSAGYMRLAKLAADTVSRNPTMDVRSILEQPQIRMFLDKMLGGRERSSLHVVSVLTSVGWTDEREGEGKAISAHLGLDWGRVRRDVEDFDRRFQIAPRSGRLRNISPTPLGIYLALEAWSIYPTEMKSLPSVLPEAAIDAYYARLQLLASGPQAASFAREELDGFFPVADLSDVRAIRRWSAIAHADPTMAVSKMRSELARRTRDERAAIQGPARHSLVGTLVALAWSSATFENAAHGLALLAEAENETVANNATSEFVQRFSIFFSATAVPYAARLGVLDELLASKSDDLRRLAFRALSMVAMRQGFRIHRTPVARGLPEREWQPMTGDEHIAAARLGIARLRAAVETGDAALRGVAAATVGELRMLLLQQPVREEVLELFATTARLFPSEREALRRSVTDVLIRDRKYWHKLDQEADAKVGALARELEDTSLTGRIRQALGDGHAGEDEAAVRAVAAEFATHPELLEGEWAWLTSGAARRAWDFGFALGASNLDARIGELITSAALGPDGRVVCAYLRRRAEKNGGEWLEDWLDRLWREHPDRADLVLEASWRLTSTPRGAGRVLAIIASGAGSPESVGQLAYGTWEENLAPDVLGPVLDALFTRDDGAHTALAMLNQRVRKNPAELDTWSELALALVTNGRLIRGTHHDSWEWNELAKLLIDRHPRELYRAIIREQARRDESHWFLEHELAGEIARLCVEKDPAGTWDETRQCLEAPDERPFLFAIGFPDGLVDLMDHATVIEWASADPSRRATVLSELVAKRYGDETLAGRLIERYGADEDVARAFHSKLMTGEWVGSSAEHWASLAADLRTIIDQSRGPNLRRWATRGAEILDQMSARDRVREDEARVRDR